MKNDLDQVSALVGDFDFAINEECLAWDECNRLTVFVDANKPVFHVEYGRDVDGDYVIYTKAEVCGLMTRKLALYSTKIEWPIGSLSYG